MRISENFLTKIIESVGLTTKEGSYTVSEYSFPHSIYIRNRW